MRRYALIVVSFLILAGLAQAECVPEPRLVSVIGEAEVKAAPDEIIFSIGAETLDKDLKIAKSKNDEIVQKALGLVKQYKIDSKYVQTDYMHIEPRYDYQFAKRSFIGYSVTKSMVITLKDITKFEDFLSAVLEAGITNLYGIQFRTTELRKYRDEARDLAIKAAQEKAAALAKDLGQKLGRPYKIMEEPIWEQWGHFNKTSQNVMMDRGNSGAVSESTISPGQLNIKATVNVSFELE